MKGHVMRHVIYFIGKIGQTTKVIVGAEVEGRKWYFSKFTDESVEGIKVEGLKMIFSLIL